MVLERTVARRAEGRVVRARSRTVLPLTPQPPLAQVRGGPAGRRGGAGDLFEALRVGQRLTVRVKTVDVARGRIGLEMAPAPGGG